MRAWSFRFGAALTALAFVLGLNPGRASAQTAVFINELHYDNSGTDADEGVEVAGPAGTDLTGWSVALYNGNGGAVYDTIALSGTIPDQGNGFGTLYFLRAGIQNGAPDGLALVDGASNPIQFLSYEGSFVAVGGPANGLTSTDIGVFEDGTEAPGLSLQLQGSGNAYEDFDWAGPIGHSRGLVNAGQTFVAAGGGPPWVNELHYDNAGTDVEEGIEIAGFAGTDLSGWSLVPYNGSNGAPYSPTTNLSGSLPDNGGSGCGTIHFPIAGLQNGAPDGFALVDPQGAVLQFLSYEGSFVGVGGPANGLTSTDIGVAEAGTETDQSLQLQGSGSSYADFSWAGPIGQTRGATNGGQTFTCLPPTPTPSPTPIPVPEFLPANFGLTLADPFDCSAAGDTLDVELVIVNSGDGDAPKSVIEADFGPFLVGQPGSCQATGGIGGDCQIGESGLVWTGDIPATGGAPNNVVTLNYQVRVRGGTRIGTELCIDSRVIFDSDVDGINDATAEIGACARVDCLPTVDPNRQLGNQVHLPILNFQGQDDVCSSWIEVQNLGCDPAKAVLITWGAPGFCPPQAAGPLKVECTGLLVPGSTWNLLGAQIPTGSKSGMLFKFSARRLSELGVDLGFDDIAADLMCETLFFGVVGDPDDYRRFKQAYSEGLEFAGVPMRLVTGDGVLAVEVLRRCPGDLTPGVLVSSRYNGLAGSHLGTWDPIYGGFGYFAPLLYAGKAGLNSVMYVQNGGLECSSVEIWFKAQDDCLRASICEIFTLAPGESYQFDASDCVGPDWQGAAWLRASQPLGIAVDIAGRDLLMTYVGEPHELSFQFDPSRKPYASDGDQVAFGPLVYSEYQGWDSGVQVQNLSATENAKVKLYFLDRSGDVITTLVDWICPRGSQTFFLPAIGTLPGNWVGSIRVESQDWWAAGANPVDPPNVVAVAQLIKYNDVARTEMLEALAYNLLPEHKAFDWQVGANGGGLESGVGLIAIPSLLKDLGKTGTTSELAIANLVTKPGFTDFALYIFDQNGLLDFICQKLNDRQIEYIDLQTWGYLGTGFKGSAIVSATFWEHDVFDPGGFFIRSLVGLGAVSIERSGTRLGEDIPGDESAGSRGIPFTNDPARDEPFAHCFAGPAIAFCPGQPGQKPTCPEKLVLTGAGGAIPDDRVGGEVFQGNLAAAFPSLPGQCVVADVNLTLNIEHDVLQDLEVYLEHIDTRSEMFSDICGFEADLLATLDDDATRAIQATCPPVDGGRYTTESGSGLDAFDGLDPKGLWKLIVDDDFESNVGIGRVIDWQLEIDIAPANP
ncbi:MAG: hypothetical protein KDH92_11090 [Chloroflexi bacterium]|nr:hypothetical protein [Chloroflexota bacterium]